MKGPNEIHGLNGGDIMLGLITPLHTRYLQYQWFRDGSLFIKGMNASVLKVTCPGKYSVGKIIGEQLYTFDAGCNVTEQFNTMKTLTKINPVIGYFTDS
ncbi:hypothetical protein DPMN_123305 [Dreissena polymorpha]|uniref:Uncharacterized protein n=1 Tax=Dreissena polymorpha TaxID=45954 RepID=A0A9D4JRE4_DREPO|nr:hypothetical protein DPMN_123305 [Dreissena polymorpha]